MNIIDLRRGSRRSLMTRRITDRRNCAYQFGSPEWVENIQQDYLAWPKSDRRIMARRDEDRRVLDRRQQQLPDRSRYEKNYPRILFTPEEGKLIEDLYLNDME